MLSFLGGFQMRRLMGGGAFSSKYGKLYYSSKCQVLRSTKISNTFLYHSKPHDVIKLGLPVIKLNGV